MAQGRTVVILGGGVGGVVTAVELRKRLPAEHRVVLVDRERRHLFAPSLLWLMTGRRRPQQISRPLKRLRRKGIEVVQGDVERIDAAQRRVRVAGATIEGDYLVVALGAELAPEAVPGLAGAGHTFYTPDGAAALRDALGAFEGGRLAVLTATPAYKCPGAPYEAAMLLEAECRRRGLGAATRVDMYAAEPAPLPVTGPAFSAGVRGMVEGKGIGYHPDHQVTAADPEARRLTFADGTTAEYDLLAYVPPHRAPRVVREAGLVGEDGWVPVDHHTLATTAEGVYAIGDVTGITLPMGKPLPMAGTFAHGEASVVARNIARAITGQGRAAAFSGHGDCFIEMGDGRAALGRGEFYAEPTPRVRSWGAGRHWHLGKVLFEKYWLRRWF